MSAGVTLALDAMGGDRGPLTTVPAALATLARDESARLVLVGREEVLGPLVAEAPKDLQPRVAIEPASQVVDMDERPRDALRKKKDSSMRIALDLVKSGRAHACVSAGNTGALMATARFVLKTLPGIDRPAIISAVPSLKGRTYMLDLGANADCSPLQLLQFAVMGSVVVRDMHNVEQPRVALLNIGEEDIKGRDSIREAGALLANSSLNYVGFIEGGDIFSDKVDVVVTDGFTGNVSLKTMEGVAKLLSTNLRDAFARNLWTRLQGGLALPVLNGFKKTLDARRYNGATLVGLNGIVIKSHGGADKLAFEHAIQTAIAEVDKGVPTHISHLWEKQPVQCTRA